MKSWQAITVGSELKNHISPAGAISSHAIPSSNGRRHISAETENSKDKSKKLKCHLLQFYLVL